MPESALTAPKEKKLTGRQWFESGKAVFLRIFVATTFFKQITLLLTIYLSCAIFREEQWSLLIKNPRRKMMKTLTLKTKTLKVKWSFCFGFARQLFHEQVMFLNDHIFVFT